MGFDNRAPVTNEHTLPPIPFQGVLPSGLRGTLYRNGPNPVQPDPASHWFFGDGMIHALRIGPEGLTYRNRWVRTQHWAEAAGAPDSSRPAGVANTNILAHANRLLALEEAHMPVSIDPVSLATIGSVDFGGTLPEGPFTAHPKLDPRTGELVFLGYGAEGVLTNTIRIGTVAADGSLVSVETVKSPYPAMVHDFAIADRFVLIPLFPLIIDATKGGIVWQPERGAFLGVMDREIGAASLRWHPAVPGFAFHVMNAWEDGKELYLDLMLSDAPSFFPGSDGSVAGGLPASLWRWRIDPHAAGAAVACERLSTLDGEFPRIDDRFAGSRTRHGYFTLGDAICHRDDRSGAEHLFRLPQGDGVSEPVFVPRGAAEGDGWLLAVAFRAATETSDLIVLDAADVAAGPIALAELPCRVPAGFHGNFLGDAA